MAPRVPPDLIAPVTNWEEVAMFSDLLEGDKPASECERTRTELKTFMAEPSVVAAAAKAISNKHNESVLAARFGIENSICVEAGDPRLGGCRGNDGTQGCVNGVRRFPESDYEDPNAEVWFLQVTSIWYRGKDGRVQPDANEPMSKWHRLGEGLDTAFDCELMKAGMREYLTESLNDPKLLAAVTKRGAKPTETELRDARTTFPILFKAAVCVEADDSRLKNSPIR